MYKYLFALLPFLFACNMATNSKAYDPKNDTATSTVISHQHVTATTEATPHLPAIKWSGIKKMTDETFKTEVLSSSSLALVDFNATWCGPCKRLEPILKELVKEYDGKINFASVDVDECPQAARNYNTTSIPFLLFLQNAKGGNSVIGLQSYEDLKKMIDNELKVKG